MLPALDIHHVVVHALGLYQPCFFSSMTLLTAALKPVLKRALHRWLLNRFFLRPLRSWNFCEWYLLRTFWSRHMRSRTRKATVGVGADVGVSRSLMNTVRPATALARTLGRVSGSPMPRERPYAADLLAMMEAMSRLKGVEESAAVYGCCCWGVAAEASAVSAAGAADEDGVEAGGGGGGGGMSALGGTSALETGGLGDRGCSVDTGGVCPGAGCCGLAGT